MKAGSTPATWSQEAIHDEDGFRLWIAGDCDAAGCARRELARLNSRLDAPLLEDMRLLVTELVSNSVRHAGARTVELTVAVSSERVRVEVSNPGVPFKRPEPGDASGGADSGWGLFLVERLSHDWGVDDGEPQRVWFEFART